MTVKGKSLCDGLWLSLTVTAPGGPAKPVGTRTWSLVRRTRRWNDPRSALTLIAPYKSFDPKETMICVQMASPEEAAPIPPYGYQSYPSSEVLTCSLDLIPWRHMGSAALHHRERSSKVRIWCVGISRPHSTAAPGDCALRFANGCALLRRRHSCHGSRWPQLSFHAP